MRTPSPEFDDADVSGAKILIYGINYAPEFTGVGRYTGEIGAALASRGAEVRVVTAPPHYPGWRVQQPYRNAGYVTEDLGGITVFRCPLFLREQMRGIWRLIAPLTFAFSSAPIAVWQIVRWRPEVVFCVEPTLFSSPVAVLAARLMGARTILHVQDLEIDAAFESGHLARFHRFKGMALVFERWMLRLFDRIVTISEMMTAKLADKGVSAANLELIRNWVDTSKIYPMPSSLSYRAELGLPPDAFVVQYAGNIGAKQALHHLLGAAAHLEHFALPTGRPIMFLIAGEGPEKGRLQAEFAGLRSVTFVGFQPEERLGQFLSLADLHVIPQSAGMADLVLPSKLGGMLASGRRIIVTAEPASELGTFLEGAALIVAPGDDVALGRAILEAVNSPDEGSHRRRMLAGQLSSVDGLAAFCRLVLGFASEVRRRRSRRQNGYGGVRAK